MRPDRNVSAVQSSDLPAGFDSLSFDMVAHNENRTEAFASIKIEPYPTHTTNLRGKVDTGAQSNILPLRTFRNIFPHHVDAEGRPTTTTPSSTSLTAYNGTPIPQYSTLTMPCKFEENRWKTCVFYVAETNGPVIFGLPICTDLGLVTMNCVITSNANEVLTQAMNTLDDLRSAFPNRFTGIGKFATEQKLTLESNCTPVRHPPRRAPI